MILFAFLGYGFLSFRRTWPRNAFLINLSQYWFFFLPHTESTALYHDNYSRSTLLRSNVWRMKWGNTRGQPLGFSGCPRFPAWLEPSKGRDTHFANVSAEH